MRAYLVTTGSLFALLALWHAWRMIAEWQGFTAGFWAIAFTALATFALAYWAWRLFAGVAWYE